MDYQDSGSFSPHGGLPPSSPDERTWAMLCHLSALFGLAIPLGNVVGPLVVWLFKKDGMPLVDDQGKEALNFQISMVLYLFLAASVSGILVMVAIGILLLPIVVIGFPIVGAVMAVLGGIKANQGEAYRYPLCIRFIA